MEVVAENLGSNLSTLSDYETYYREGDKGEIRFYLDRNISEIEQLEACIVSQGVILTEPIKQVARVVIIKFEKRIAPLLIIGGAIAAIAASLLGWQIFKATQWGIPLWVILIGGGALAYLLLRKPVKAAAPLAIQAGKVYITKKMAK